MIRDASGNLHGTTSNGGHYNSGTVFELDAAGNETVLHSFSGADGASPFADLVQDAAGNLYSTTQKGGVYDRGTVFELDAAGNETVLYSFGGRGGNFPLAELVQDAAGNLYGTAQKGGAFHLGTVFKLNTAGKRLKVLHSFAGADGSNPIAGLVRDTAGNLYGTTIAGGTSDYGTVFKMNSAGKYKVLYSFKGGEDGQTSLSWLGPGCRRQPLRHHHLWGHFRLRNSVRTGFGR